jgi:hypothetical protein
LWGLLWGRRGAKASGKKKKIQKGLYKRGWRWYNSARLVRKTLLRARKTARGAQNVSSRATPKVRGLVTRITNYLEEIFKKCQCETRNVTSL